MYLVTVRDDYFWYETIIANCTSCKSSYNDLSHSHWGLGQFLGSGGGGGVCLNYRGIVKKLKRVSRF